MTAISRTQTRCAPTGPRRSLWQGVKTPLATLLAGVLLSASPPASAQDCPLGSVTLADAIGPELQSMVGHEQGARFDSSVDSLQLSYSGGAFGSGNNTILAENPHIAAVGDFDRDRRPDVVTVDLNGGTHVYVNRSTGDVGGLTPDFAATTLETQFVANYQTLLAAGDFNGDGAADVVRADATVGNVPHTMQIWVNTTVGVGGMPTFATPAPAMASSADMNFLGQTDSQLSSSHIEVADVNGDRKLDLLIGSADTGGTIRIFLNACTLATPLPSVLPPQPQPLPCSDTPTFHYAGALVENLNLGANVVPAFAYADFDMDGIGDLVVAMRGNNDMRYFKGKSGGGVGPEYLFQLPTSVASTGVSAIESADFTLDGRPDLLLAVRLGSEGRIASLANSGTSEPFVGVTPVQRAATSTGFADFFAVLDINRGLVESDSPDFFYADPQAGPTYFVATNNVADLGASVTRYVNCGEVQSDILPVPSALVDKEFVITAARIAYTGSANGGSIEIFMSSAEPAEWVRGHDCGDSSTNTSCVHFPDASDQALRWMVRMCSDTTASSTTTPVISAMEVSFDYTEAKEHYLAGSNERDGVVYISSFSQPGDSGELYAVNATLDRRYWNATDGARFGGMDPAVRRIFTPDTAGTTALELNTISASNSAVQDALGVDGTGAASEIIGWMRSDRFGTATRGYTSLGSIFTSAPVALGKPEFPVWYNRTGVTERQEFDNFRVDNTERPVIVLAGSRDGMLHAFRDNPVSINDTRNGTEAWAFVPAPVAQQLAADHAANIDGNTKIASYPDGEVVVADIRVGTDLKTVAIVTSGKGGRSISAIDITRTIDPSTDAILGPTPLWHRTPGAGTAGLGLSRPAVARLQVGGSERFSVIAATSFDYDETTAPRNEGRIVAAYDAATGAPMWRFRTVCPVTTDITVFETNDSAEPGAPALDGFMDRAVFADACGYVYKVDPAVDLAGGWNGNAGLGSLLTETVDGTDLFALFATNAQSELTFNTRPIAGNIAAFADGSTRTALFFGTGGLEQDDPRFPNAFYVLYADTGEVRDFVIFDNSDECLINANSNRCEKVYGGVVVTPRQVVFTTVLDPVFGASVCDGGPDFNAGRTRIRSFLLDDLSGEGLFQEEFGSAIRTPLSSSGNAIYMFTNQGQAVRLGNPKHREAGDESRAGGSGFGKEEDSTVGTTEPMRLLGWRQIY